MALFWPKALPDAQMTMIPAKINLRFNICGYSFFIVRSPVFVAREIFSSLPGYLTSSEAN
jgi:hypothetical protein